MNITLSIPDEIAPRVLDGLCGAYMYEGNKLEGETKVQFAKRMIGNKIKVDVTQYEAEQAASLARQQAIASAGTDINLT